MATANPSSGNRWYPPALKDPELNNALKIAFDQIYACVVSAQPGFALDSGVSQVTGSLLAIQTRLTNVTNVVWGIDNGDQPLNEIASARPSPAGKGKIDIYVWMPTGVADTTPIPSTTKRTVRWTVIGTK